jgi:hypothetical protein
MDRRRLRAAHDVEGNGLQGRSRLVFTHDHQHGSKNELTLQYLGVRLFNAAAASIKLALSGYYQPLSGHHQPHSIA